MMVSSFLLLPDAFTNYQTNFIILAIQTAFMWFPSKDAGNFLQFATVHDKLQPPGNPFKLTSYATLHFDKYTMDLYHGYNEMQRC